MAKDLPSALGDDRRPTGQIDAIMVKALGDEAETSEESQRIKRAVLLLLARRGLIPIDEVIEEIDGHPLEIKTFCNELCRSRLTCTHSCDVVYDISDRLRRNS